MAVRTSVQFTVGRAGSGKTCLRCGKFLTEELLPETSLHHWSNFPYEPHVLATIAAERCGASAEEFEDRLHVFPPEELAAWRRGESGPWAFFDGKSLADTHIAIDEIHEYAGAGAEGSYLAQWQKWLGTIRHQGATIEFLTQNEAKVARVIKHESGLRRELMHSDERPDPFFHIELGDWYELRAKLTGTYLAAVWETLGREANGRFIRERSAFITFFRAILSCTIRIRSRSLAVRVRGLRCVSISVVRGLVCYRGLCASIGSRWRCVRGLSWCLCF